ncbi:hypothetical protein JW898_03440 [Candidatus Woesearchaeota archaeon]|nr:hypothetical protein [Candidatus Woesearchaeota archaeon]
MFTKDLKMLRERVLSDCPPGTEFWTCHGSIVRNIYEMKDTIRALNEYAFKYHVNEDNHKNDFAEWIGDVLDDHVLAYKLGGVMDKKKYVDIIEKRIKELESA